jgi:C-terminal processing protease CtpA/Prc
MKWMLKCLLLVFLFVLPAPVQAQLSADQRVFDFQNLVALYAKRYAPYDWKRQAVAFDLFDIQPWIDRIRAAKSDLEFFEIQAEYVAGLQDTHSGFQMTSSFRANLGMTVDIYDGKVLIDTINRAQLPMADYPFQIGDEIVSVDRVSAEDWIKRISAWRKYGNPVSTRRLAAGQITFRSQPTFPRAHEIGDTATVEIRRASGALETYTIRWAKAGLPVTTVGPVPFPAPKKLTMDPSADPEKLASFDEFHNYMLPDNDLILSPIPWSLDADGVPRTFVNGVGARPPIFVAGLPPNFVQRLGRLPADFHYSGTYVSNGLTIGYLRIPSFAPNLAVAFNELRSEIDYFQRNTDGLVVDVMRNPGGGCYMMDAVAALTPYPFYFFGEQIRATQDRLNSMQAQLDLAVALRMEEWVILTYQIYVDQMKAALSANRGMTVPIAACRQFQEVGAPHTDNNQPAPNAYTKPLIILIDEFSISAADIFPSMMQDNGRGVLVGMRSSGGGGSVSGWPTGFYSESISTNTNTLVVRKNPIRTQEYPTAPYVENIGARPDIQLNFMTRENLLNGGRSFVEQFTQILVNEIMKK